MDHGGNNNGFQIPSKDKRNQMFAVEVKNYIIEDNVRKNMILSQQKKKKDHGPGNFASGS